MTIEVTAFYDDEADVWVAESDDVPGLITEAPTMERLIERLQTLIPELGFFGLIFRNCGISRLTTKSYRGIAPMGF